MRKFLKALGLLVGVSACAFAAPTSGPAGNFIINNSTSAVVSTQEYNVRGGTVTQKLFLPFLTPGQCHTTDSTGKVVGVPCGNGAASIAVTTGAAGGFATVASSPTAVLNFEQAQFNAVLKGAATAYISLNQSSVTLQGNDLGATYLTNSSATANYLSFSSATANFLTQSSATATYFNKSNILPVANGGTGTSTPGLVAGTNITSITGTWPNQTINASGGGGSGGGYAMEPATVTINAAVGLTASTIAVTNTSNSYYAEVITATGTKNALRVIERGLPDAAVQSLDGGAINIQLSSGTVAPGIVIVSSSPDSQIGAGVLEIWEESINHNDPLIWIHNKASNSAPFMRIDDPQPDMEMTSSSDSSHGRGKWEPLAIPAASEILQVNSRSWDNTSFENVAYWEPLSIQSSVNTPGLFIRAQDLTNDSGVISSSNTGGINFFTQNNHTIGLTGPMNVAAGSWRFRLPATLNNAGKLLYQSDNGDAFNDRTWSFLDSVAVTQTSMTVVGSGGFAVNGSTGDGIIVLTVMGSTYTVISSSIVPTTVGQYAMFSSTSGTVIGVTAPTGGGGGGSGAPIAITTGVYATTYSNPAVSSPTVVQVYDQNRFNLAATGTTGYITLASSQTFSTMTVTTQFNLTATTITSTGQYWDLTTSTADAWRLKAHGSLVCTADGTNCPASGGGGGSPIAITTGTYPTYSNPAISTPMVVGVFRAGQFIVRASGTTGYFELDPSSVTLAGTNVAPASGSSNYIQNGTSLQTATFNVTSGTVNNFTAADSTSTNITATKITATTYAVPAGNNQAVLFFNGNNIANSSSLKWNGTTLTATNVNGGTVTATASMMASGPDGLTVKYGVTAGSMTGAGLSTCGDSTHGLSWTAGQFGCQSITGSGSSGGSVLAVTTITSAGYNNPAISSPTAILGFNKPQFLVTVPGGTTAFVQLDGSSVTLQGNTNVGLLNSTQTWTGGNTYNGPTTFTGLGWNFPTPNLTVDRIATKLGGSAGSPNSISIGNSSLNSFNTSSYVGRPNVAIGPNALANFIDGGNTSQKGGNTAVGYNSLGSSTDTANTGIGDFSGAYLTYGNFNSFLGSYSGIALNGNGFQHGENNTFIGQFSGPTSTSTYLSNSMAFGYASKVGQNNALSIGCVAADCVTSGYGQFKVGIGTDTPTEPLYVVGNFKVDSGSITVTSGTVQIQNTSGMALVRSTFTIDTSTNIILGAQGTNFNLYQSSGFVMTSDSSTVNAALTALPGMAFAIAPNETWEMRCTLIVGSSTAGMKFGINGPSGMTVKAALFGNLASATAYTSQYITALNTASAAYATGGVTDSVLINGEVTNGSTAGTVTLQFQATTATQANAVFAGSFCGEQRVK